MARERADGLRFQTPRTGRDARHLDAAVGRQVVDQRPARERVRHVAVERERNSPVSHARTISAPYSPLGPAVNLDPADEPCLHRLPLRDLLLAPAHVLVERNREALDEIRPPALDEPRHVLGEVLRRLGHEVAEVPKELVADAVGLREALLLEHAPERRVQIVAVALQPQVEREVVDAGDDVVDLIGRNPEIAREVARRALHRVAETDARTLLASATAQQSIDIGLTYCSSSASAHNSSMSAHTPSSTGIVRSARMIPPTPSVSAIVCRSPNRFGTSKSSFVASSPPIWNDVTT